MADDLTTNKLLMVIIAILIAPLAVYLKTHSIGSTLVCVLLWFLGGIPGVIFALWVVLK